MAHTAPIPLVDKQKWIELVGRFILGFGDIELVTMILWKEYFDVPPLPHNFKERTGSVLARLRRDETKPTEVTNLLVGALKLADSRNAVAHHPLQIQFYEDISSGSLHLEQAISSEINDEYITFEKLTHLVEQTESIRQLLYRSLWPSNDA